MNCIHIVTFPFLILFVFATSSCQTTTEKALDKRGTVHVAEPGGSKKKDKKKGGSEDTASVTAPYGLGQPKLPTGRNPNISIPRGDLSGTAAKYSRVPMNEPYIALTFDDGPHATNTPRLLDMLKERNVKATFYVVGTNAKQYPHILRRMINEGHEIGNHTKTHPALTKLSDSGVRNELNYCRDAIIGATGVPPVTMRPPYGATSSRLESMVHSEYGYPSILWSVDPQDWRKPGPRTVANRLVSGAGPGGILLVHDIHRETIDAMPETLDRLLAKGYRFVTVSQLIKLGQRGGGMSSVELGEGSRVAAVP
ncbi:MAG: polysaccharide deacetylase family protein [Verrucomicrobiota bacterium]